MERFLWKLKRENKNAGIIEDWNSGLGQEKELTHTYQPRCCIKMWLNQLHAPIKRLFLPFCRRPRGPHGPEGAAGHYF